MMMNVKLVGAVGLVATLAACGSSSDETLSFAQLETLSFAQLETQGIAILERFETTEGIQTVDMPVTGSATYTGVAGFTFDDQINDDLSNVEILSRMSMSANFAGSTINGRFDNFTDVENTAVSGSVVWQQANIVGSSFETTASGTLTGDGDGESANIDLIIAGGFFGESADFVLGASTGFYKTDDDGGSLSGIFVGEK